MKLQHLGKSGTGVVSLMLNWDCVCGGHFIWLGDDTYEDYGMNGEGIVSNGSCSGCGRSILLFTPMEDF